MTEQTKLMDEARLYKTAFILSAFTILANIGEGVFSTQLGFRNESLALFGFGIDSFIEVLSAIGITIMLLRIWRNPSSPRSKFEVTALRITGISFYILTAGLLFTGIFNLITRSFPETTFWGIIISILSISTMIFLYLFKLRTGKRLNSDAIIADANCTKTCIYMSIVLLISSLAFELTGVAVLDVIGAFGIAWFSYSEGREAFQKATTRGECNC
jgi:divalent metal cation (Fe/Co/Zn/Cd) transporter